MMVCTSKLVSLIISTTNGRTRIRSRFIGRMPTITRLVLAGVLMEIIQLLFLKR